MSLDLVLIKMADTMGKITDSVCNNKKDIKKLKEEMEKLKQSQAVK